MPIVVSVLYLGLIVPQRGLSAEEVQGDRHLHCAAGRPPLARPARAEVAGV